MHRQPPNYSMYFSDNSTSQQAQIQQVQYVNKWTQTNMLTGQTKLDKLGLLSIETHEKIDAFDIQVVKSKDLRV